MYSRDEVQNCFKNGSAPSLYILSPGFTNVIHRYVLVLLYSCSSLLSRALSTNHRHVTLVGFDPTTFASRAVSYQLDHRDYPERQFESYIFSSGFDLQRGYKIFFIPDANISILFLVVSSRFCIVLHSRHYLALTTVMKTK